VFGDARGPIEKLGIVRTADIVDRDEHRFAVVAVCIPILDKRFKPWPIIGGGSRQLVLNSTMVPFLFFDEKNFRHGVFDEKKSVSSLRNLYMRNEIIVAKLGPNINPQGLVFSHDRFASRQ